MNFGVCHDWTANGPAKKKYKITMSRYPLTYLLHDDL